MAEEEKQEKKLIIDEDWKKEAQHEKEVLAAKEAKEKQEQVEEDEEPRGPLPKGDLAGLISMLTTQALFALGVLQIKGQEDREPDLEMAKYNIDMLEALQEKTKGNLTPPEENALKNTLSELRMGYVQVSDAVSSS
ncbi:MAG: DUF1844 domain-containing protein [Sedimentisphaerales bacterium]|nr:DUF1844 domain-containing protein [Sedimentisphaerales bacterium]